MGAVPRRGLEVLRVDGRADGVDVAAQDAAGHLGGDEQAAASGGVDGVVDGVVAVGRGNGAGLDAGERVGARDATEVYVLEIRGRRVAEHLDVGHVVAVGNAQAGEAAAQRITQRNREAVPVLDVVDQVVLAERVKQGDEVLPGQD